MYITEAVISQGSAKGAAEWIVSIDADGMTVKTQAEEMESLGNSIVWISEDALRQMNSLAKLMGWKVMP